MTINAIRTICIAGPTASGKSSLALKLAANLNATIINADALQVYDNWQVLTARPSEDDLQRAPHALYGHVDYRETYSVGAWLRDIAPLMASDIPKIIVGGTGLYFSALTKGLAEIPAIPQSVRAAGDKIRAESGAQGFHTYLQTYDPKLFAHMDQHNPMRLQRAWEVHQATGRPLSSWQADTPAPLLDPNDAVRLVMQSDATWLNARIDRRFDQMLEIGALEECQRNIPDWDANRASSKALGAPELIAMLRGELTRDQAIERAKITTHQFAKRQRTWFRSKMGEWQHLTVADLDDRNAISKITSML